MSKFVKLTIDDGSGRSMLVNLDRAISVTPREEGGSVVTFSGVDDYYAEESVDRVLALIEAAGVSKCHAEETPYIVAVNDGGYQLIGPFEGEIQAVDWAEQKISDPRWNVVFLKSLYQMPEITHPFF